MSNVLINRSNLENIASAIRAKGGASGALKPGQMAEAIRNISGGGYPEPTGTINITTNGTHNVKDYASASVNVSGGGGSNVTVSRATPQGGANGDLWVQYANIYPNQDSAASVQLTLVIVSALRGSSLLAYAGAAELDVIFSDDDGHDISMRELSDFSYTGASALAFDNNPSTYWENNPTPITATLSATVPAGYRVKELKVMQRSSGYTTDVWKEFNLSASGVKIMEYKDLNQSSWAGANNYTHFSNLLPDSPYYVVDTWVHINGNWVSPAKIDVEITE